MSNSARVRSNPAHDNKAREEAFLGPGQRVGTETKSSNCFTHLPSKQRGGALVAVRYDAGGNPVAIAHVAADSGQIADA